MYWLEPYFHRIVERGSLTVAANDLDVSVATRVFDEPQREHFLSIIQVMAMRAGGDPLEAVQDAMPLQYLVRAIKRG